jgi:c-di-GMP-binding flagellar brake protein YcgR
MIGVIMVNRAARFEIERPVEFRLTGHRNSPQLHGRTVNISSGGVLIRTEHNVNVGQKIDMVVRMARLTPESMEVDLHLLGITVRSGQGWVAAQIKKHQILPRAAQAAA